MKNKLLFLTSQLPELSSGSQVRSYYMLQYLKKSYDVTLCCVTDQDVDVAAFKKEVHADTYIYPVVEFNLLQRILCLLQGTVPYVQRYRQSIPDAKLQHLLQTAEICFFSELNGYFIAERHLESSRVHTVIDAHNVEYIKFAGEVSSKSLLHWLAGLIITPLMKRIETNALHHMQLIFACSAQDKKMLKELAPKAKITVVPNGVDCSKFKPVRNTGSGKSLFFMGSLGYPPNDDGLKFFLEKIYPKIKVQVPGVTFTIIGKGAREWLQKYARKDTSVQLLGFVPDVRVHIANATVCVCPLRFGSGTRLKILEYMAMEMPVVATHIGAEGIEVQSGHDIFLADTPAAFIEKTITLLQDEKLATAMGQHARKLICKQYDWEPIISEVVQEIKAL